MVVGRLKRRGALSARQIRAIGAGRRSSLRIAIAVGLAAFSAGVTSHAVWGGTGDTGVMLGIASAPGDAHVARVARSRAHTPVTGAAEPASIALPAASRQVTTSSEVEDSAVLAELLAELEAPEPGSATSHAAGAAAPVVPRPRIATSRQRRRHAAATTAAAAARTVPTEDATAADKPATVGHEAPALAAPDTAEAAPAAPDAAPAAPVVAGPIASRDIPPSPFE